MNALLGLGILAAIIYGILIDAMFWKIYGICFAVYLLFVMCLTNRRDNLKRRILTLSTWSRKYLPSSNNLHRTVGSDELPCLRAQHDEGH